MIALAQNAVLFWVTSVAGGLIFSALNGGLINRLMERVPEDDRPAHMALHNLALNLGVLIGSLVGPLLGGWLGLQNALFASAALRLAAGILLMMWG
jgi:predicted MFS family arabinose efflux permease